MAESTETITIRVPKSLKQKLEELSDKNHITLNLLINQILTKNVHWDEHVTKMGWLQFDPNIVRELFKYLEENEINDLGITIKKDIVNGIKFIYGDTSFEHTIEFINSWLTITNIPFRYTKDTESHKFFVTHELGKNWSKFANKVLEEFVKELGFKIKDLQSDSDSYSFTITR